MCIAFTRTFMFVGYRKPYAAVPVVGHKIDPFPPLIVALQFNSHRSVQKLFHNLHIIFSNSLMSFKVICQLEKEPLEGLANVQEIFDYYLMLSLSDAII